jgi:hypothetical protein
MLEKFEFGAELAAAIAAAEAALAEIVPTRPAFAETYKAALLAYERAQHRFENFGIHATRATRHGADDASPVLLDMIDGERGKRDAAGAAMTRAKKDLENCDWVIECRTADLTQLRLMVEPPKPPLVREDVKRPVPDNGDVDMIVMPPGTASRAA